MSNKRENSRQICAIRRRYGEFPQKNGKVFPDDRCGVLGYDLIAGLCCPRLNLYKISVESSNKGGMTMRISRVFLISAQGFNIRI